jgi:hypothetical protein
MIGIHTLAELCIAAINLQSIEFISYFTFHLQIYNPKKGSLKTHRPALLLTNFSDHINEHQPSGLFV